MYLQSCIYIYIYNLYIYRERDIYIYIYVYITSVPYPEASLFEIQLTLMSDFLAVDVILALCWLSDVFCPQRIVQWCQILTEGAKSNFDLQE